MDTQNQNRPRVIVLAGYIHQEIMEGMIESARSIEPEVDAEIVEEVWVPGTLETPIAAKRILETGCIEGLLVFGVQQLGETSHGEVIAHQATSKLLELQLAFDIPMGIAIIGPGATLEHAKGKADRTAKKAFRGVVHMINQTRTDT